MGLPFALTQSSSHISDCRAVSSYFSLFYLIIVLQPVHTLSTPLICILVTCTTGKLGAKMGADELVKKRSFPPISVMMTDPQVRSARQRQRGTVRYSANKPNQRELWVQTTCAPPIICASFI